MTQPLALAHVRNLGLPAEGQDLSIYAENVHVLFPYAPEGHTRELRGVGELSRFLAAIGEFTTGHAVQNVIALPTGDGFVLNYTESSVFRGTGNAYSSEIVWLATVEGGRITALKEFYDPLAVLRALGE